MNYTGSILEILEFILLSKIIKNFYVFIIGAGEVKMKKIQFLLITISEPREKDRHGNKHSPTVFLKDYIRRTKKCHNGTEKRVTNSTLWGKAAESGMPKQLASHQGKHFQQPAGYWYPGVPNKCIFYFIVTFLSLLDVPGWAKNHERYKVQKLQWLAEDPSPEIFLTQHLLFSQSGEPRVTQKTRDKEAPMMNVFVTVCVCERVLVHTQ